jgi:hypothetical protein
MMKSVLCFVRAKTGVANETPNQIIGLHVCCFSGGGVVAPLWTFFVLPFNPARFFLVCFLAPPFFVHLSQQKATRASNEMDFLLTLPHQQLLEVAPNLLNAVDTEVIIACFRSYSSFSCIEFSLHLTPFLFFPPARAVRCHTGTSLSAEFDDGQRPEYGKTMQTNSQSNRYDSFTHSSNDFPVSRLYVDLGQCDLFLFCFVLFFVSLVFILFRSCFFCIFSFFFPKNPTSSLMCWQQ